MRRGQVCCWLKGWICIIFMSRPLRLLYPGAWYHVMNRGRNWEVTFTSSEDYLSFVELLKVIDFSLGDSGQADPICIFFTNSSLKSQQQI